MGNTSDETATVIETRNLLDALEALGSSLDLNRTADHVLEGLTSLLPCEVAHIFIRDRDGSAGSMVCQRTYESDGGARTAAKSDRHRSVVAETLRTGRAALSRRDDDEIASSMVAPIVGGGGRVLGALLAEAGENVRYGEEELARLMSYARAAAPAIERALLYAQLVSDRRMTGELEVARQVMAGLLPSDSPKLEGFDIAAVIESAYEVGGDYYDFIPLGNERWSVAMADVSGKGAPAALVVAALAGDALYAREARARASCDPSAR